MANECRYTYFDDAPGSTHNLVVALVPDGANVLEVGCATGYMSEVLRERRGCTVTGIEIVPDAAAEAESRCDRVIVGNAEELDFDRLFTSGEFDVLLFADVLEHLRDPENVLRRLRPFLRENGAVVASVPNVAHGSLRLALLGGEFRYQSCGLLDQTHLRFFTRESLEDLFDAAGYVIVEVQRQRLAIEDSEVKPPFDPPADVRELLARDPEATTYQFIVQAVPAHATTAAERRTRASDATLQELEAYRQTVADQLQHIEALESRNQALAGQMSELRGLLEETQQGLAQRDEEFRRAEMDLATRRTEEVKARDEEIHWLRGVVADLQAQIAEREGPPTPRRAMSRLKRLRRPQA